MTKIFTCIECPKSCALNVEIDNCRVVQLSGNKCPKGLAYVQSEVENPSRIFTSTVLTRGLSLKMLPVKTDKPIAKSMISAAAAEVKKIKVSKPVRLGEVVAADFLGSGANLVATRNCLE